MQFSIERLFEALPIAGAGMLGVFIVIAAILVVVKLLCRLFKEDKEN